MILTWFKWYRRLKGGRWWRHRLGFWFQLPASDYLNKAHEDYTHRTAIRSAMWSFVSMLFREDDNNVFHLRSDGVSREMVRDLIERRFGG